MICTQSLHEYGILQQQNLLKKSKCIGTMLQNYFKR
jgi:hypothetical protein